MNEQMTGEARSRLGGRRASDRRSKPQAKQTMTERSDHLRDAIHSDDAMMQRKRAKYERLSEIKQNNYRVQYTFK
jgi:hypothetical protein